MAKKRHGGLGRGLDALIPQKRPGQAPIGEKGGMEGKEGVLGEGASAGPAAAHAGTGTDEESYAEGVKEPARMPFGMPSGQEDGQKAAPDAEDGGGIRQSMPGTTEEPGVRLLRLSQVDPNRSQPRSNFEEEALEELADSIRQFGVLQPILVQKKGGRYEIIAGERRWRASRKAGLSQIPAIVREYSDEEAVELSLIENIQREDLNPIEEAKAFKRLLDEFGLRQEDLAARVSKSRTAITNAVRLLKLDARVQDMIVEEKISMGHARALISIEIPEEQYLLATQAADRHLSVREVEKLVKNRMKMAGAAKESRGAGAGEGAEKDPALELAYRAIEERLRQSLGTKATIRHGTDGTGRIEIAFYSHEDLEKIVDLLSDAR